MFRPITIGLLALSCVMPALAAVVGVAPIPAFTADIVTVPPSGKPNNRKGRLFVSTGRVRIEVPESADGFFIVDVGHPAAWFVRPSQRLFMDARQSNPLTQLLIPVDPGNPCGQWQTMETVAGGARAGDGDWRCEQIGSEVIDGRETVKYLAISGRNQRSYRWIDPQRAFPLRVETADGKTVVLENIVDGPQSANLFILPAGYQKFDPQQLIERIKQSDVWVEPPR